MTTDSICWWRDVPCPIIRYGSILWSCWLAYFDWRRASHKTRTEICRTEEMKSRLEIKSYYRQYDRATEPSTNSLIFQFYLFMVFWLFPFARINFLFSKQDFNQYPHPSGVAATCEEVHCSLLLFFLVLFQCDNTDCLLRYGRCYRSHITLEEKPSPQYYSRNHHLSLHCWLRSWGPCDAAISIWKSQGVLTS